ncbi:MAG: 1-deoxy-D-xylulose-5-phosphate reductoisomerase [Planctomycetota bacterium]|nr:1-deoxy-D-xylulose-5-phosphate reductoisomerase [Planctomycetota bacterium]
MMRVVLVGATGSIGRSTLDVIRALSGASLFAAFARRDSEGVAALAAEFAPEFLGVADDAALAGLAGAAPGVRTGSGVEFLEEVIADARVDVVVSAATGAAGLPASLAAARHGKRLALANKESMVMAGPLLLREARASGATIVPVDSEHSAIFQAIQAGRPGEVASIILTASGGPFREWSAERIAQATPADALAHPTWSMGRKVTVDSASLINKSLEIIEAHWLFDQPARLQMVIHPQSLVHGMVEFVDGSIIAQMSCPDMRLPIQYALTYPDRRPAPFQRFDVRDFARLTFEAPDLERFPGAALGSRAVALGGTAGAIVNAANEVAVQRFLDGAIPFPAISRTVEAVLEDARIQPEPDLDDIYTADRAAREDASKCRI